MKSPLSENPIRRVDVVVGASLWLWNLWLTAESPWLVALRPRMLHGDLYPRIAAFIVLSFLFWSIACLGVALGRRWGLLGTAILLTLASLSSAVSLMVVPPSAMFEIGFQLAFRLAALVYCLARFNALKPAPRYPRAFQ